MTDTSNRSGLGGVIFVASHAILAIGLIAMISTPIVRWYASSKALLDQKRVALARFENIASQEAAVQDFVRRVGERNASGELLKARNVGAVSADLQAKLKMHADASGVVLRSLRALPEKSVNTSQLIGARIEGTGTIEAVRRLIHAFDTGTVLFAVPAAVFHGQGQPLGLPQSTVPMIDVQLDVYAGYILQEAP